MRLAAVKTPDHQAPDPCGTKGGDQQIVEEIGEAPVVHVLLAREHQFLPPHLDHVVDALTDTAAIDALEALSHPRQARELVRRVGRPHIIASLEIGEPVVGEVMAELPQTVGRQRREECEPPDPFVQPLVRRIRAVAGVVPDDEQSRDPERRDEGGEHGYPPGIHDQHAGDRHTEHQPVEQKPDDRCCNAAIEGERLQELLEPKPRFIGRGRPGGRIGSSAER